MPVSPGIKVEGLRQFNRAVSKSTDRDIPKQIGQVNKRIGAFVRDRLQPRPQPEAVGSGAGATVRPSATRREVILRVGGAHRASSSASVRNRKQWGKTPQRVSNPPARPNIIGTAEDHADTIEKMLLDGYEAALKPPFQ